MKELFVRGLGVVSSAGWGMEPFRKALEEGQPRGAASLPRPGWPTPHRVRQVPPAPTGLPIFSHPRMRRCSPITRFALAAATEALGGDLAEVASGKLQLGIVAAVTAGCVNYSRRFLQETLDNPATASPMLFPETVFNAPASHVAAFLGSRAPSYTLVGDAATFIQAIALAQQWIDNNQVDACLVIGAEESDWVVADALGLFDRSAILGDGAGAVYLGPTPTLSTSQAATRHVAIQTITPLFSFYSSATQSRAARAVRDALPTGASEDLLCVSSRNPADEADPETAAWSNWPGQRSAPKAQLGEGLAASAAWQVVSACDAVRRGAHPSATISVIGTGQQAAGLRVATPTLSNG